MQRLRRVGPWKLWPTTSPGSACSNRAFTRPLSEWRNPGPSDFQPQLVSKLSAAAMSQQHKVYLSLGSNINAETNLPRAIQLLANYGDVEAVSGVWESHAVGSNGPNFLNASVLFLTELSAQELKERVIGPVEAALGRIRTADKNAPRTIDIDIMMVDGKPFNLDRWDNAFVLLPIADLLPEAQHPLRNEKLRDAAESARRQTWIVQRPGLLKSPP